MRLAAERARGHAAAERERQQRRLHDPRAAAPRPHRALVPPAGSLHVLLPQMRTSGSSSTPVRRRTAARA